MNIEIANRLVELRKKNNLSQEALAGKLGISRQAVSKWERAEASPDTDNLILLARLYGVSLDELLKTDEEILPAVQEDNEDNRDNRDNGDTGASGGEGEESWFPGRKRFPMFLLISFVYIFIGCFWNAWHPGWLLFFLVPVWDSLIMAIEKRNAYCFAYPVLVTLVYLCLGFFWFLWHPGWIVFLTIPLYYPAVSYFRDNGKDTDHYRQAEGGGRDEE